MNDAAPRGYTVYKRYNLDEGGVAVPDAASAEEAIRLAITRGFGADEGAEDEDLMADVAWPLLKATSGSSKGTWWSANPEGGARKFGRRSRR